MFKSFFCYGAYQEKLINLFESNSFREKIASPSQARVTAALKQGLGLRLLRTDIDEVFHPLEKRRNKNPDEFESFE